MATVLKPKGRSVYYAKFQHKGKAYFLSTGEKTRKEAAAWMADKLAEVKGEQSLYGLFDRVIAMVAAIPDEKKQDETRRSLIKRLRQGKKNRVGLADAWVLFDKTPRKKTQGGDWRGVSQRWFSKFTDWMSEHHPHAEHLDEVSEVMVTGYARHLLAEGISASTYNRKVHSLALVFKTLKADAGLAENVWDTTENMDVTTEGQRPLEDAEVKLVLAKAYEKGEPNLMLWLMLGVYTGLRLKDVITITWDNVDFSKRLVSRVAAKTRKYTNGKAIPIPMAVPLETALKSYRDSVGEPDETYLFPDYAKDYKGGGKDRAEELINTHYKDCGIRRLREKTAQRKRRSTEVGFHSLRHTFITMCADNRVPLHDVQAMVGHMTQEMTQTYTHSSMEGRRKAVSVLPDHTPTKKKPTRT